MIYQATQFEVARDGALTRSLNLIVSGKGGTAMENAKKLLRTPEQSVMLTIITRPMS